MIGRTIVSRSRLRILGGEVDANSVEMLVNGVGLVPANYEPKSKVVTNAFTGKLAKNIHSRSLGQSEGAKTRNPLELCC
jgi:hypothetical protein